LPRHGFQAARRHERKVHTPQPGRVLGFGGSTPLRTFLLRRVSLAGGLRLREYERTETGKMTNPDHGQQ
jgi:hypothetical protein